MDERLLKRYLEYAGSEEALAVLFVKKHLKSTEGHWVDVRDYRRYEMSNDDLHFRFVIGQIFKRTLKPNYPSKSEFTLNGNFREKAYYLAVRAITWEASHTDIEQQKQKRIKAKKFEIIGVSYDKKRGNKNFFIDSAPPEIHALAKNLSDRTNPLWDCAMDYINQPEFVYEIKKIKVYT
jgi:hypothetical protein